MGKGMTGEKSSIHQRENRGGDRWGLGMRLKHQYSRRGEKREKLVGGERLRTLRRASGPTRTPAESLPRGRKKRGRVDEKLKS